MNPSTFRLLKHLSAYFLLLAGCVMLLALGAPHLTPKKAAEIEPLEEEVKPIQLTELGIRHTVTSLKHTPGFIPPPEGLTLENASNLLQAEPTSNLKPNFNRHDRYWLHTKVHNATQNSRWMLHISIFGVQQANIILRSSDGQVSKALISPSADANSTDINALGRAAAVNLAPGQSYTLWIELKANHAIWPPHIALMDAEYYETWKGKLNFYFVFAIGLIVGLVLLGFLCWLIAWEGTFFWGALASLIMLIYYLEHSSLPALLWQSNYEKSFPFWALFSTALLSQLAFSASFLKINRNSGRWLIAFIAAALITISACLASSVTSFATNMVIFPIAYLAVSLVIITSGIAKALRFGRYYVVYLLGWFPIVLSYFQVVFIISGVQDPTQEIGISYKIISVLYVQILHMFVHAIAIVLRIRALREEKIEAEALSRSKSQFMAQSSHDLSQPLNSMRLFVEHLKPYITDPKGREILYGLKVTHSQMSESFISIMDLSKLESGGIKPEFKHVSISNLLKTIEFEYQVLAAKKGIQLRIHNCSIDVSSDPILLERMLRNLISNAIKYTDRGKVVVGCRRRNKEIILQVLDSGCGIEHNAQGFIFDIYYRSRANIKNANGFGIGLSIVKHISELLDHPLTFRSTPGKGSCFSISVPRFTETSRSHRGTSLSFEDKKASVALVLRNTQLKNTLRDRLEQWGYHVITPSSVDEVWQNSDSISMTICESRTLRNNSLSTEEIYMLGQKIVAAFICSPNETAPENWIALTPNIPALQLRALLNGAIRRLNTMRPSNP